MLARLLLSPLVSILLIMLVRSVATGCVSVLICALSLLWLGLCWLLRLVISHGVLMACPLLPSLVDPFLRRSLRGRCVLISVNYLFI